MFTLQQFHKFPAQPARCRLAAWLSPTQSTKLLWSITLESQSIYSELIPPEERGPGWDKVGVSIRCEDIDLDVLTWAPLRIPMQSIRHFGSASGFRLQQWEPLLALRLQAKALETPLVDVLVEGTGAAESVSECFGGPKVDFAIHTKAIFTGVTIQAPTDISNPLDYADAIRRRLIPDYLPASGDVQSQTHSGTVVSVMVHYAPASIL